MQNHTAIPNTRRKRTAWAPIVVLPGEWAPDIGDPVILYVPKGRRPAEGLILPLELPLTSAQVLGFISVAPTTPKTFSDLEAKLCIQLPKMARTRLDFAIRVLIESVGLITRFTTTKTLKSKLDQICETHLKLMRMCSAASNIEPGSLSSEKIISLHLGAISFSTFANTTFQSHLINIGNTLSYCKNISDSRPKHSRQLENIFHLYLKQLFGIARDLTLPMILPRPGNKSPTRSKYPLLMFVREAIALARNNGSDAIGLSKLTNEEKNHSMKLLRFYEMKKDRAICDFLRELSGTAN
jgi:hypothetical protein